MLLRKYQEVAVDAASKALDDKGNTLVVAPTGAGKTIMLSALIGKRFKKGEQVLVLQHRDELVSQNSTKFHRVNNNITTSEVNAANKDWSADTVFAMVQTLSREKNLERMPKLDLIVVDEAHHTVADTYQRIINAAREANEGVQIVGFTATPNRGDKAGLRGVFDNCSHQIEISTLIDEGFLVRPKTFVIDVGVQNELREVRKTIADFDMEAVERIMNRRAVNVKVVEEWQRRCIGRKTIAFCSTIKHATDLCEEFHIAGVNAEMVTGDTPKDEREEILYELAHGDVEVVVNVAVLTEGFDAPPVSCIILTRPCSYKSTMVQMVGRGLRTIDPEEYPGVVKTDCVVLDFGTSILTHGSLDDPVNLDGNENNADQGPVKICPECNSEVPLAVKECPICGHEFASLGMGDAEELEHFELTEVDLIDRSPFRWIDLFSNGACMSASGFNCFAMVADVNGLSIALVKKNLGDVRLISVGTKRQAMAAADDFMRVNEDSNSSKKTKRWLNERITDKQRNALHRQGIAISAFDFGWTKYKAACMLNYVWNKRIIDKMVYDIVERESA
jgi:DNA repair protein RadD|tara:strand:+ start:15170 stop:16852 length:1683 start_codon:yes stop_codon:yes gene_type:complete